MNISRVIDHTLLRFDCTIHEIKKLCDEAIQYDFSHVCVPPYYVREAFRKLEDAAPGVCAVAGFPFGYSATPVKVEEIKKALEDGADEVDIVVNIAAIKSGDWSYVANDIEASTRCVHLKGKKVKIILETAVLTEEEIKHLCGICLESDVDFIKTSTGINSAGATPEMVRYLKSIVGDSAKIKASGGIRTLNDVQKMLECGADRIGTSSGVSIVSKKK
jgi:deoxyribose-phosphate aldolase